MAKETMTGFITEFRFFHQMQPVRPVSACAQALWHYLFYRANAAFWQFPLKIQANEIAGALRISRSAFMRSREELRSAGYLLYEHDPGTRTVKYYLVSNVRPHIAGYFADFADWHEALAEAFGDFDLDEGAAPRTFILYVPARRREDHYEVWPMPDGLMVL